MKMALEAETSGSVKIYPWASRTALDVITSAAFGYDFNAIGDPNSDVLCTYRTLFAQEPSLFFWLMIGVPIPVRFLFNLPLRQFEIVRKSSAYLKGICYDVVKRKREAIEGAKGQDSETVDLLSVALRSSSFSNDDLANQLMTFLAAGHETTATSTGWTMFLLCKHPEVQTRLREEIRANLPSLDEANPPLSALQVDRLPYLNAVINESLRFIPPVPALSREAKRDTTLAGHAIPKGTRLFLSPWAVNCSFALWGEDALEFKPERWLAPGQANAGGATSNFAWMTFFHGNRACIGKDFAKSEMLCLVAAWVGRYEWSLVDPKMEFEVGGHVTLRPPSHGIPMKMREIGGW